MTIILFNKKRNSSSVVTPPVVPPPGVTSTITDFGKFALTTDTTGYTVASDALSPYSVPNYGSKYPSKSLLFNLPSSLDIPTDGAFQFECWIYARDAKLADSQLFSSPSNASYRIRVNLPRFNVTPIAFTGCYTAGSDYLSTPPFLWPRKTWIWLCYGATGTDRYIYAVTNTGKVLGQNTSVAGITAFSVSAFSLFSIRPSSSVLVTDLRISDIGRDYNNGTPVAPTAPITTDENSILLLR